MKTRLILGVALAVVVAANAWAGFGIPSVNTGNSTVNKAANKGIEMGKNKAVESVINDKLAKYNCAFKSDKATLAKDSNCKTGKIAGELSSWKMSLENTIVNKVKVNVMAHHKMENSTAMERARNLCNEISKQISWWDCIESAGTGDNSAMFSVSVN